MKYSKHNCTKQYVEKIFPLILLSNSAEVVLHCYIYWVWNYFTLLVIKELIEKAQK